MVAKCTKNDWIVQFKMVRQNLCYVNFISIKSFISSKCNSNCVTVKKQTIALYYGFGFHHTSTWISHRYTYIPSWTFLPPPNGDRNDTKGLARWISEERGSKDFRKASVDGAWKVKGIRWVRARLRRAKVKDFIFRCDEKALTGLFICSFVFVKTMISALSF